MSQAMEAGSTLHVVTLTPFFPSDQNEVSGCYVAEPIAHFAQFGLASSVIAVSPIHHRPKHASSSSAADWVRYPQLPGNFGLSSAGKLLYARLRRRIQGLNQLKTIDVIHAHAALPCGHAALLLSRHLNIPFVVTVHGMDVFNNCHLSGTPAAWRRQVSMEVYRAAKTVICISDKVEAVLKAEMPAETCSTVVYNGVDPNLFSPSSDDTGQAVPEILVIGTLLPSKGHELVLRALRNLTPSLPQLRCRIIGEGPYRVQFESLVRDLGIAQQVEFASRLSRSEVAEAMRRCSVFVLPSRNEALGCVYLEAMSCGKPVIACQGQGIDEVIEHGKNGWLIPADSVEDLVRGLSDLLGSPELRSRMGAAARETILKQLTLSHQAQRLAAIYRQVRARGMLFQGDPPPAL